MSIRQCQHFAESVEKGKPQLDKTFKTVNPGFIQGCSPCSET